MAGKSTIRRYKSYTCSKCDKPYVKMFKASSFEELEDTINEFNADEGICLRCSGNGRVNLIRDLNFRLRAGI